MTTADFLDEPVEEPEEGKGTSKYSGLLKLSGLSAEDAARFRETWVGAPSDVKRDIPQRLIELSEDNFELDFSTVFRTCLDDPEAEVRALGVRGLWECEERTVIRPLIALLAEDPSAEVRAAAATGLSRFASMAQDGKLLGSDADRIRDALLAAAGRGDEEPTVRRRAMEAVSHFDSPAITEMIREAYASGDPELKRSAIFAMGQSSNARWLRTVIAEMEDELAVVRYEAATACGLLGEESSAPHLIVLLEDEDPEVQHAAVRALGGIGGPLARQALNQCLKMGDEALAELAEEALGNLAIEDDPLGPG